jgi:hypothetical protein
MSVSHFVTEPHYSDEQLIKFAEAFLQKHLKIKKNERQLLPPLLPISKLSKSEIAEQEQIHASSADPTEANKNATYSDLSQYVEKRFFRQAGPHHLRAHPAINSAVGEYLKSTQTPVERARLYTTVENRLNKENFQNTPTRAIYNLVTDKDTFSLSKPKKPAYDLITLDSIIQNTLKEKNTQSDIVQTTQSGKSNLIPFQRETPVHEETLAEQIAYNYEKERQRNIVSNLGMQRVVNLHFSASLVKRTLDQLYQTRNTLLKNLKRSQELGNFEEQLSKVPLLRAGYPQSNLEQIQNDLVRAHPDFFTKDMTTNDVIDHINRLIVTVQAQYSSIVSDVHNPTAYEPPQRVANTFSKSLYELNPETYKKQLRAYVATNPNLTDLQRDIINQEIESDSVERQGIQSYFNLAKKLDQTLPEAGDRTQFDNMFDIYSHINAHVEYNTPRRIFEFQTRLHGLFHNAINKGQLYEAQGFLNAMWHPTTGEESLEHLDPLTMNRKYYDGSNELVKSQLYQNEFTKTLPEQLFQKYIDLQNNIAAFVARQEQYGQAPNQAEMAVYAMKYKDYVNELKNLNNKNPGNLFYDALSNHLNDIYSPSAAWYSLHMPSSRFTNYYHDLKSALESRESYTDNSAPTELISSSEHDVLPHDRAEQSSAEATKKQITQGGSVLHHFRKHAHKLITPLMKKVLSYNAEHEAPSMTDTDVRKKLISQYAANAHHHLKHLLHHRDGAMHFEQEAIQEHNDAIHHHNMSHYGGMIHHYANTYTHHKPHHHVLYQLHKIKQLESVGEGIKHVKGCGICGTTADLYGHPKHVNDITCKYCLDKHGISSKRGHASQAYPLESSSHKEHKELLENIKHNNLIKRHAGTEEPKNLFSMFNETYSGKKNFINVWKKSYVMDRDFVDSDFNKMVYAIGFYLYNEPEVTETFIDNLNASVIRYMEKHNIDDKKVPLTHKFLSFNELKDLIKEKPGVLKTLIFDLDH